MIGLVTPVNDVSQFSDILLVIVASPFNVGHGKRPVAPPVTARYRKRAFVESGRIGR